MDTKKFDILNYFTNSLLADYSFSNNTVESYSMDVKHFLNYIYNSKKSIIDITENDIKDYLNYISQHIKATTLARKIFAIKKFFKFLTKENYTTFNPCSSIKITTNIKTKPSILSEEQIQLLLNTVSADNNFNSIRNQLMLEILYATGMKVSELVSLTMDSLSYYNFQNQKMICVIIKNKYKKSDRITLLYPKAVEKLENYLKVRSEMLKKNNDVQWIFYSFTKDNRITHITRQRFGQILKQMAIQNNLDPKIVSPNKIRHSFAKHMLNNGANLEIVKTLLGHSNISLTQIYKKLIK